MKKPTLKKLMDMESEGYCTTPDGCIVEPDGECPHGEKSWLLILGMI